MPVSATPWQRYPQRRYPRRPCPRRRCPRRCHGGGALGEGRRVPPAASPLSPVPDRYSQDPLVLIPRRNGSQGACLVQSRLGNKRELINGAAGGTSIAPLGPNPARSLVLLGRASRAPTAGGWATSLAAPRRQASGGQGCCAQGGAARACALLEGWLREAGGARRPPGRRRRWVLPCRAGAAASRAELPWGERNGSHQLHSATSPRCHLHPTVGGPAVGPPALLVSWAEPRRRQGAAGGHGGLGASWPLRLLGTASVPRTHPSPSLGGTGTAWSFPVALAPSPARPRHTKLSPPDRPGFDFFTPHNLDTCRLAGGTQQWPVPWGT